MASDLSHNPWHLGAQQALDYLLAYEAQAQDDELFALGYLIPQIDLVCEWAQAQSALIQGLEKASGDFIQDCTQVLQANMQSDALTSTDRQQILALWQLACTHIR